MSSLMDFLSAAQRPNQIQVHPPQRGGQVGQQPVQLLRQMIALAHQYIGAEPDQVDKQTMLKVLVTLQGYLANEQKQAESAGGVTPQMKFLQKNS